MNKLKQLTPKQKEELEKLATLIPDLLTTIKYVLNTEGDLPEEDLEILDIEMGKCSDLAINFFQFKDRSGEPVIDVDPMGNLFEGETFKPLMDLVNNMLAVQTKERIFTALMPIMIDNNDFRNNVLFEKVSTVNIYSDKIIKEFFTEGK